MKFYTSSSFWMNKELFFVYAEEEEQTKLIAKVKTKKEADDLIEQLTSTPAK